jgi:hypothetical protein
VSKPSVNQPQAGSEEITGDGRLELQVFLDWEDSSIVGRYHPVRTGIDVTWTTAFHPGLTFPWGLVISANPDIVAPSKYPPAEPGP